MPEGLDFELGFAIEDPMGIDALLLARALIRFGRLIPPEARGEVARQLDIKSEFLEEHCKSCGRHCSRQSPPGLGSSEPS
jgi:hypothetical protein